MKFQMRIDSGHSPLTVELEKTEKGWIASGVNTAECNLATTPAGKGGFLQILSNHAIYYPAAAPACLIRLWNKLNTSPESENRVQKQLQLLGEWIAACDKGASPELER